MGEIAFAILHCTGGDLLIAVATLMLALLFIGADSWPKEGFYPVLTLTVILGAAYTVFSEWLNVVIRQSWAYSELMPVIPVINTGLAPFLQWLIIPAVGLWWARRSCRI